MPPLVAANSGSVEGRGGCISLGIACRARDASSRGRHPPRRSSAWSTFCCPHSARLSMTCAQSRPQAQKPSAGGSLRARFIRGPLGVAGRNRPLRLSTARARARARAALQSRFTAAHTLAVTLCSSCSTRTWPVQNASWSLQRALLTRWGSAERLWGGSYRAARWEGVRAGRGPTAGGKGG